MACARETPFHIRFRNFALVVNGAITTIEAKLMSYWKVSDTLADSMCDLVDKMESGDTPLDYDEVHAEGVDILKKAYEMLRKWKQDLEKVNPEDCLVLMLSSGMEKQIAVGVIKGAVKDHVEAFEEAKEFFVKQWNEKRWAEHVSIMREDGL